MADIPGTAAGSARTEDEIISSVDAWVRMYKLQQEGSKFVKADIVRRLQADDLKIINISEFIDLRGYDNRTHHYTDL